MASPANVFILRHAQLHVSYSNGQLGSIAELIYQDSHQAKKFPQDQLRRVQTDLGEEVSVTLQLTPDLGSTSFTLIVPKVQLDPNQHVHVDTIGVTAIHRRAISPSLDRGQLDSYHVVHLTGSAASTPF